MRAFVLVKDEVTNLPRSLPPLLSAGLSVVVLDSGSTDGSQAFVAALGAVEVRNVEYRSHLEMYNRILTEWADPGEWIFVLDADMIVSEALVEEATMAGSQGDVDLASAPIEMWWGGFPLRWGSVCPAKAVAFRAGRGLFVASGHGERPQEGTRVKMLRSAVIHDDRKPFAQTLATQARYGRDLAVRVAEGHGSVRDRIRARWPVFVVVTPLWAILARGGFRAGRVGLLYAIDRLIAEAVLFRQCLARRLEGGRKGP